MPLTLFIEVQGERIVVLEYTFHWQSKRGKLIKRWDKAKHHPKLEQFPHHVHEGREENVKPARPLPRPVLEYLAIVEQAVIDQQSRKRRRPA